MSRPSPAPRPSWTDRLRTADWIYLVDRTGNVHQVTPAAYEAMDVRDLRGSSVFLTRREADRCAVTRRKS